MFDSEEVMAKHARIGVSDMEAGTSLRSYLEARAVRAYLPGLLSGSVEVLVRKPRFSRDSTFVNGLVLMVQAWVMDGHAARAVIDYGGIQQVVEPAR